MIDSIVQVICVFTVCFFLALPIAERAVLKSMIVELFISIASPLILSSFASHTLKLSVAYTCMIIVIFLMQ